MNLGDGPGVPAVLTPSLQARMGDVLRLLKEKDGWYLLPDGMTAYLGWVGPSQYTLRDRQEVEAIGDGRVAWSAKTAPVFSEPSDSFSYKHLSRAASLHLLEEEGDWVKWVSPAADAWMEASKYRHEGRKVFTGRKVPLG